VTRVTVAEVQAVYDTDKDLMSVIVTASLLVDEELVSSNHSAARLKQIELYLAAHFAAVADERGALVRSTVGESAEFYAKDVGQGLKATIYGQQAITLDTSGVLATIAAKGGASAKFSLIGKGGSTRTTVVS